MKTSDKIDDLFKVCETLQCIKGVGRRDGMSRIEAGESAKVTQAFSFRYKGKQCQDITVQHENDAPIAVLTSLGHFKRIDDERAK